MYRDGRSSDRRAIFIIGYYYIQRDERIGAVLPIPKKTTEATRGRVNRISGWFLHHFLDRLRKRTKGPLLLMLLRSLLAVILLVVAVVGFVVGIAVLVGLDWNISVIVIVVLVGASSVGVVGSLALVPSEVVLVLVLRVGTVGLPLVVLSLSLLGLRGSVAGLLLGLPV